MPVSVPGIVLLIIPILILFVSTYFLIKKDWIKGIIFGFIGLILLVWIIGYGITGMVTGEVIP